jgi:hypothetical protein
MKYSPLYIIMFNNYNTYLNGCLFGSKGFFGRFTSNMLVNGKHFSSIKFNRRSMSRFIDYSLSITNLYCYPYSRVRFK